MGKKQRDVRPKYCDVDLRGQKRAGVPNEYTKGLRDSWSSEGKEVRCLAHKYLGRKGLSHSFLMDIGEALGDAAALLLKDIPSPGWAAQLVGAFDPQSGHMPRWQVQSPVRA